MVEGLLHERFLRRLLAFVLRALLLHADPDQFDGRDHIVLWLHIDNLCDALPLTGSIGLLSLFLFVRKIYSSIKID